MVDAFNEIFQSKAETDNLDVEKINVIPSKIGIILHL